MSTDQAPPPDAAPAPDAPWRRWARDLFIVTFLLVQVGVPLIYYVGDDVYDERFAWRMFSPVRMTPCQLSIAERGDGGPWVRPKLNTQLHVVWIELMQRGRRDVIHAWVRSRCDALRQTHTRAEVRVQLVCRLPDGTEDKPIDPTANLCEQELP